MQHATYGRRASSKKYGSDTSDDDSDNSSKGAGMESGSSSSVSESASREDSGVVTCLRKRQKQLKG